VLERTTAQPVAGASVAVGGDDCAPLLCATEECPGGISCTSSSQGVTISWTNSPNVLYDSITVTRNGTPIAGSPFPGDTQSVLDSNPGNFLNSYEVSGTLVPVELMTFSVE